LERRLVELVNDRLTRGFDSDIELALEELAKSNARAYDDLADLAESCAKAPHRSRRQGARRVIPRGAAACVVALSAADHRACRGNGRITSQRNLPATSLRAAPASQWRISVFD